MKKMEFQKHKFDNRLRMAIFFGLIAFAVALQLTHSSLVGEVVAAVLVLVGVNKPGR